MGHIKSGHKKRGCSPVQLTRNNYQLKAVFALLQTTSALVSNDLGPEHTQLLGQSIDSLAMLAHTYAQLTQLRKNQIRPALKPEYSAICSLEES